MRLWRISNFADLSGAGGRIVDGRWHSRGRPVVYLSEHPALALVENLVHLEIETGEIPETYQLLEIDAPEPVSRVERTAEAFDAENLAWRKDLRFTRSVGDAWLAQRLSALLLVPSVVVPRSVNALLNPAHADAALLRIGAIIRPAYDRRLFA